MNVTDTKYYRYLYLVVSDVDTAYITWLRGGYVTYDENRYNRFKLIHLNYLFIHLNSTQLIHH